MTSQRRRSYRLARVLVGRQVDRELVTSAAAQGKAVAASCDDRQGSGPGGCPEYTHEGHGAADLGFGIDVQRAPPSGPGVRMW
jgi:hypothetical protein